MPQRWYGTLIEARVRLDPFAQGWSGGSVPFFLSLLSIYLSFFYPYLKLTLDHRCVIPLLVQQQLGQHCPSIQERKEGFSFYDDIAM